MDEPPRTIFKIRATRRTREYVSLAKIFAVLLILLGACTAIQVGACRWEHPKRPWRQCVDPLRGREP